MTKATRHENSHTGEKPNIAGMFCAWGGALIAAALFGFLLHHSGLINKGTPLIIDYKWVDSLDIHLSFAIDSLSLLFALIITGIGSLIFIYAAAYFKSHPQAVRIHLIMIVFMLSMLGLVTTSNLFTMFIFWEMTTVTSYLLIGTKHDNEKARQMAWQALLVTGAGGLAFLAGLILLGSEAGSHDIMTIVQDNYASSALYLPIFTLIVLGCFTKSAIFPFHFWLPNAMAAPTPISAYLHSATMVKAGVYLLARFSPALSGTDIWLWTLTLAGGITAVWPALLALRQTDLKLMMAYTTLMALGSAVFLIGLGTPAALLAALIFILAHALYKATLFMVVGNIETATGRRDWCENCRLYKIMPLTAIAAILGGLSMASIPPFAGFIAKDMIYKGVLNLPVHYISASIIMTLAAIFVAGAAFFIMSWPFFRETHHDSKDTGEASTKTQSYKKLSLLMSLPALTLGFGGLIAGLMPGTFMSPLLVPAANILATLPAELEKIVLWHGFNGKLILSFITFAAGALIAWKMVTVQHLLNKAALPRWLSCEYIYDLIMKGLIGLAALQTAILQNGRQRFYILACFLTMSGLSLLTYIHSGFFSLINWQDISSRLSVVPLYQWILAFFIGGSVIVTVFSHSRLLAICALGVMGTGIALLFVIFSAPDVAMTQFMIEILVVILMTMIILRLPAFSGKPHGSITGKLRDGIVALCTGGTITALMLAVNSTPFDRDISRFYEEYSYIEAHGRNIVNVILVDFRALDTLGEILVIALSGLACYALLTLKKEHNHQNGDTPNNTKQEAAS